MANEPCPHCGFPPLIPEVCTPEVNEAIERAIEDTAEAFYAGREHEARSWRARRLLTLATNEALSNHLGGYSISLIAEGHEYTESNDHGFDICPHPDCELVRETFSGRSTPATGEQEDGQRSGCSAPDARKDNR